MPKYSLDIKRKFVMFDDHEGIEKKGLIEITVSEFAVRKKSTSIIGENIYLFNPVIDQNTEIYMNVKPWSQCKRVKACGTYSYQVIVVFPQDTVRMKIHQDDGMFAHLGSVQTESFLWKGNHKSIMDLINGKERLTSDLEEKKIYEVFVCFIGHFCVDCWDDSAGHIFSNWGKCTI